MTPAPTRRMRVEELTDAMRARARERLAVVALLLGLAFVAADLTGAAWYAWGGRAVSLRFGQVDIVSASLWLVLAAVARIRNFSDRAVLRAGQVFVVLVCLSMATFESFNAYTYNHEAPLRTYGPLLIATYPLLIPTPARKTLRVVATAVAMSPLGILLAVLAGATPTVEGVPLRPLVAADMISVSFAPAIGALVAVVGSDLIYRTSIDVAELREEAGRLSAVLGAVGDAVILRDDGGAIVFANVAARSLLGATLEHPPPPLAQAMTEGQEGTIVGDVEGRAETFHIARTALTLLERRHEVVTIRRLTPEIDKAEVATWRKLIRALSHELNNTIAPMSSFLHSLRVLVSRKGPDADVASALDSLDGRVKHLADFLSEYASLARLPNPRPQSVAWQAFVDRIAPFASLNVDGALPERDGYFDAGQIEQVVVNLVANARQAGSPPEAITLRIEARDAGFELAVLDRGHGFSREAHDRALLPFYSTRPDGAGLGLALSREIVVAHGGWIAIENRPGGGAIIRIWLPAAT